MHSSWKTRQFSPSAFFWLFFQGPASISLWSALHFTCNINFILVYLRWPSSFFLTSVHLISKDVSETMLITQGLIIKGTCSWNYNPFFIFLDYVLARTMSTHLYDETEMTNHNMEIKCNLYYMKTFNLKLLSYFKGLNLNLAHSWKNYKIIYFYVYVLFPHICRQWPSRSIVLYQKQK